MKRRAPCRKWTGLVLGVAFASIATGRAFAEGGTATVDGHFSFSLQACPQVSAASVRRILDIEIGDLLLAESEGVSPDRDRLTVRCVGKFAWIQAARKAGAPLFEQIVNLDAFPGDAAPRALALAGLELLASLNAVVRERIENIRQERPAPPSTPRVEATHETSIGLAGAWRVFPSGPGPSLWGGQLQASSALGRWLVAADLEATGARAQVDGVGGTSALLLSGSAAMGVQGRLGHFRGSFGVGGRFGYARLAGTSADPTGVTGRTVWHPWGGPLASATAQGRWGRFAFTLRAEVGRSVSTIEGLANEATALAIRGTWAGLTLGGEVFP